MNIVSVLRLLEVISKEGGVREIFRNPSFSLASFQIAQTLSIYESNLNTIVDAGANKGQFALASSNRFPDANIFSYEPLPETFELLQKNTRRSERIKCFNYALGNESGTINFYQNNYSHVSSALKIDPDNTNAGYDQGVKDVLRVPVYRLDELPERVPYESPSLLKLDVQGFERNVIEGAGSLLPKIDYILLEVSFEPLYEEQPLFLDLHDFLVSKEYRFVAPLGFQRNESHKVIEMDVLYRKD